MKVKLASLPTRQLVGLSLVANPACQQSGSPGVQYLREQLFGNLLAPL